MRFNKTLLVLFIFTLLFAGNLFGQTQLQITTTSLPGGVVGTAYPLQVLGATGGTAPYGVSSADCAITTAHWCVDSGSSLPLGLTLTTDGILRGTPTASGTSNFIVQLTDSGSNTTRQTAQRSLSITITAPLIVNPANLPNGAVGTSYSPQTLSSSGGTLPNSWTVVAGALPQGLSLSSGGTISGTPTFAGRYTFTVRAVDSSSPAQSDTEDFSITVPPLVTTNALPNGAVGLAYTPQTLTAGAGNTPYTWAVTAGTIPSGLTLSGSGVFSGIPTTSGTFDFTVGVTDSSTPTLTGTKPLSIVIQPPLVISTTSPLATGVLGVFYSQQLAAIGPSPVSWSVAGGTLPPGIQLSASGALSGTPSVAQTFSFVVQATGGDPLQTTQRSLSLTINPALAISTLALPNATRGVPFSFAFTATGGVGPYAWSSAGVPLPPGLSFNSAGVLSGTPTSVGTFQFAVQVTDSFVPQQQLLRAFNLTVSDVLTVTTNTLPNGEVGKEYSSQTLTASAGTPTYSWSVLSGTLPAGLTLLADGTLSGTPTAAGSFNFTVQVTDSSVPVQTATKALSLTIASSLVITTSALLPTGVAGAFYSQQLTSTGPSPVTWTVASGTPPPGLQLSTTGALSGIPSVAQTFSFVVQATGGNPVQTTQRTLGITINPALAISTLVVPNATLNSQFSFTFGATGGVGPYVWSSAGVPLPTGLSLSTAGVLSGTPTNPGTFQFAVEVADSFVPQQKVLRAFNLTVSSVLTVTTTTLPNGEVGKEYTSLTLAASAGTPTYSWSVTSGTLPLGMSLLADGTLTGTPTATGTSSFTVTVRDSSVPVQTATKALSLTILPSLSITTPTLLPIGVVDVFYSKQLELNAASSTAVWSPLSGSLPPGLTLTPSGLLSGIPAVAGSFDFTLKVDDTNPVRTAQKAFRVLVSGPLSISTLSLLPDGALSVPYSLPLAVTGGQAPYTWTNPGRLLPPGLSLSNDGVISGTPTGVGAYSFIVQVSDSFIPKQEVSRTFTLLVNTSLRITTISLPRGIQNVAFSQQLQADGGTAPLSWVISGGSLTEGLTLSPAGLISGTPVAAGSRAVTVTVTDARGLSAVREFNLVVDPPVPALAAPSLPASLSPAQFSNLTLSLASPHPSPLTGRLRLTFSSKAEVAGDDPMTRFSTGARVVSFSIPANSTAAVFESAISLLTGTVTGTVRLAADIDNGPQDVPVAIVEIAATAPQMTNITAVRTSNRLEVQISGYSPSRRVTTVDFTFDLNVEGKVSQVTIPANVDATFSAWYTTPASLAFGSAFSFVQAFNVQGDTSMIQSVTVRLSNAQGGTASAVIPFK
jgi:hypothetical protein